MDEAPVTADGVKPLLSARSVKNLLRFSFSDRFQLLSSTFVAQALRILTTIVMARWLTPRDYGLVGLTSAIPGVISSLGDFGAFRCLIQIRDLPDREVRETALALSAGLSAVYAVTAVSCGIALSFAYHDSRLVWIAGLQAATSFLAMLYGYQMANLSRDLLFNTESKQNLLFAGSQALSGMIFAVLGFGRVRAGLPGPDGTTGRQPDDRSARRAVLADAL